MIEQREVDKLSESSLTWQKVKIVLSLTKSARAHETAKKRIDYAKEDLLKNRSHVLSSYSELCVLVAYELCESETVNEMLSFVLAWSAMGHLFTRVGRIHWKLVLRK